MRKIVALFLFWIACAGCGGPTGPAPVHDANSQLGGTVLVQRGDSAWSIAQRSGVPLRDLIEANNLRPPYVLKAGQQLFIPNLRLHRVQRGESISVIAERFSVGRFELARLNNIAPPYRIFPRQILKIPGSGRPTQITRTDRRAAPVRLTSPPSPPVRVAVGAGTTRTARAAPRPGPSVARQPTQQRRDPAPKPRTTAKPGLIWPVGGRLISGFGPKRDGLHNDGVNIAAPAGENVVAASDGSVVYAGNEIRGFGNLVLIRHPNGLTTAYAHLDETLVERGQKVRRGAPIATVGNSGGVNRPQLHFEIRKGRKALDPIRTLGNPPTS